MTLNDDYRKLFFKAVQEWELTHEYLPVLDQPNYMLVSPDKRRYIGVTFYRTVWFFPVYSVMFFNVDKGLHKTLNYALDEAGRVAKKLLECRYAQFRVRVAEQNYKKAYEQGKAYLRGYLDDGD